MTFPQPGSEYLPYRAVLAAEGLCAPSAWTFKSHPVYREILEHVSPEQGEGYLACVRAEFPDLWRDSLTHVFPRLAKSNDRLGSPVRAMFPSLELSCSPTNFRYLYHALRVLDDASHYGPDVYLIELGAGYGGLAYYIHELADFFGLIVRWYYTVDLPEACFIQERYALEQEIPLVTVDGTHIEELEQLIDSTRTAPRYLISAYAFSEFSADVRSWYTRTLVHHCKQGFLVWNMIPVYPFTDEYVDVEDERPLTGHGNKYVTYGRGRDPRYATN